MFWIPFLFRGLAFTFWFSCTHGFDFVVSPPTQCGPQRFTWVGGTPPFSAVAIVADGTMKNFSIPANSWNERDQSGDFETTLALSEHQMVVFSMGDATGPTTGGNSAVMTVGAPAAGAQSCNTTDPGTDFFFATDGSLVQCKDFPFSIFKQSGAVLPITVLVTVPQSESFYLHPPDQNDPFNWKANLTTNTKVFFTMTDSQNRVGGTSSLLTVQASEDSSCVHPPPSSAPPTRVPSPTGSAPPSNTGNNDNNHDNDKNNSHTGLIVGVAVGGAVALIAIIALVYFFARRNGARFGGGKRVDLTEPGPDSSTYLLHPGHPQHDLYPKPTPFPTYHDTTPSVTPFQPGPSPGAPVSPYNNNFPSASAVPMDASMSGNMGTVVPTDMYGAGVATAAAAGSNAQTYPPMSAKQREAMEAQQRHQQYQLQQQQQQRESYFNPYEQGAPSPPAPGSTYYTASSRQTAQTDTLSQFGVASSSGLGSTVGPSTASSTQGSSNKRRTSSAAGTPVPQQQRFIVHTDIEDEPIELPPVYSESRAPIPGIPAPSAPQSGKGGM